jgi:hypothetical protein
MKKWSEEGKHNKFSAYLFKVQSSSCKYESDKESISSGVISSLFVHTPNI